MGQRVGDSLGVIDFQHWNLGYALLLAVVIVFISIMFYLFLASDVLKGGRDHL
ncbi:hypothetical protein JOD43_002417 [Pullulanibacillus pueri]|nr:hypothetical protein [Pullulanibacillus pueri]